MLSRPLRGAAIEARVGGTFRFEDTSHGVPLVHSGRYVEIAKPHRLAFTLTLSLAPAIATRVAVDIERIGRGCRLALAHLGIPAELAPYMRNRWTGILYGLAVTLDSIGRAPENALRSPS